MKRSTSFKFHEYLIFTAALIVTVLICVCIGSVNLPLGDTIDVFVSVITRQPQAEGTLASNILLPIRLPRVISAALVGAALSLSGAAMQGLLKNPLADGSTLGVSSGASLGAVISLAFGVKMPDLNIGMGATMALAMLFAFVSLAGILLLSYRLDSSLSTNTIILMGVIFSMFASSLSSLVITFAGDRVKTITFWTMGSLQSAGYQNAAVLLVSLLIFGGVILSKAVELNAFAIGEDNARSIGVNVRSVKLAVLICASAMIGVCVAVSGTIGFVGLVTPHMVRLITGPNHKRLLPASVFGGAVFLMLSDLAARILLNPRELPIGVVTSMIGSVVFIYIFCNSRKGGR